MPEYVHVLIPIFPFSIILWRSSLLASLEPFSMVLLEESDADSEVEEETQLWTQHEAAAIQV